VNDIVIAVGSTSDS